jgi:hypothetical protein
MHGAVAVVLTVWGDVDAAEAYLEDFTRWETCTRSD